MSEFRLAVWTVECGEKCRWFVTEDAARRFAIGELLAAPLPLPEVSHKVIWDVEELCEILNHIEGFTEGGEPQAGAFPSIDFKRLI